MGYLVLARKYRPHSFDTVVGQEAAVRTLQNALRTGRIAHAYLFTGPRGVGKTSIARILARGLQCVDGPTPDPCGTCERCLGVAAGRDMDVVEIDGASNRGIENIRDLRESVRYAPTAGRYKVYIVDEVHQITQDAFNAFLKTLEEPPEHVVFVFATTEPAKVPETIRSRCQVFEFRRVSEGAIAAHVRSICESEQLELEPGMDLEIARRARGGLRDALSLLDQLAAYGGRSVGFEAFRELTGYLAPDRVRELLQCVLDGDAAGALHWISGALERGSSAGDLADQILEYLRALLHRKVGSDRAPELPGVDPAAITAQCAALDEGQLLGLLQILADGRRHLREMEDVRLALEMIVLEMVHVSDLPALSEVLGKWTGASPPRPRRSQSPAPMPRRAADSASAGSASSRAEPVVVESATASPVVPAGPESEAVPAAPEPAASESDPRAPADPASERGGDREAGRSAAPPAASPSAASPSAASPSAASPSAASPSAASPARPTPPDGVTSGAPARAEESAQAVEAVESVVEAGQGADLASPPFPPELELHREVVEEAPMVEVPLPPLPEMSELYDRIKDALREEQPSTWLVLQRSAPVELEGGTLWIDLPEGALLDRGRLDSWVRQRSQEWYQRPVVLRPRVEKLERPAEDQELAGRLALLRERFKGEVVRE